MAKNIRKVNFTQKDLNRAAKDWQRNQEKERKDLERRAKPLHELTREEYFSVESVVSESYSHYVTPMSEMRIGGRSSSYHAGYSTRTSLEVKSTTGDIPVRSLVFDGFTAVKKGDRIRALIPKYEEHKEQRHFEDGCTPRSVLYTERPYKETEEAIEIAIIDNQKEVMRKDRSVNYARFTKE